MFVEVIVFVAVGTEVEVAATTVTIFVWITVTIKGVCVGKGVTVADGVLEARNDVTVAEMDAEGGIAGKGSACAFTVPIEIRIPINKIVTRINFAEYILIPMLDCISTSPFFPLPAPTFPTLAASQMSDSLSAASILIHPSG